VREENSALSGMVTREAPQQSRFYCRAGAGDRYALGEPIKDLGCLLKLAEAAWAISFDVGAKFLPLLAVKGFEQVQFVNAFYRLTAHDPTTVRRRCLRKRVAARSSARTRAGGPPRSASSSASARPAKATSSSARSWCLGS